MYSWTDVALRTERVYNGITGVLSEAEFYGVGAEGSGWTATRTRGFALIDRLAQMNARIADAVENHDAVGYIRCNLDFHRMLYLRAQAPAPPRERGLPSPREQTPP